jgi:hypothetical protein
MELLLAEFIDENGGGLKKSRSRKEGLQTWNSNQPAATG